MAAASADFRPGSEMKVARSITDIFSQQLNPEVKLAAEHGRLAAGYAPFVDVTAIRFANLRLLIHEIKRRRPGRLQKLIAADLGLSPSYLSQLVTGKKMGDEVARKIEAARHLEHGWMDHLQGTRSDLLEEHPAFASHSLRIDPDTIAAAIRLVRLSFLNLDLEIDQEENGLPLAVAYEFLLQRNERQVTPDNVVAFRPVLANKLKGAHDGESGEGVDRGVGRGHRQDDKGRKAS